MTVHRRRFLAGSLAACGSFALPGVVSAGSLGANEEIRVGVMGCGIRGAHHIDRFGRQEGVRVAAVCDADRERTGRAAASVEQKFGQAPSQHLDVREMLEKGRIDVLSVATMQYWHALPTIWACQAGKDVFVEKPAAHYIREGQRMVEAARKYDRLVQIGTQTRSSRAAADTIRFLQEGGLGKIEYVVAFANKPRTSIGKRGEPLPIPESVDYDLWCGPADDGPVYRDRLQYDCSFTWDKGDGESCNQGVHEIDVARWLLQEPGLPRRTLSLGGRFVFNDAGDVPNTQIIYYDFPSAPVLYEVHNLRAAKGSNDVPSFRGYGTDVCAHCEGGYAMIRAGHVFDRQGQRVRSFGGGEDHFENFIRAVRGRRREDLAGDILEGHLSTAVCHLGNISQRVGRLASPAECRRQIGDLPLFQETFDRLVEHLKAHEIDVEEPAVTLGDWIDVDPQTEGVKNHEKGSAIVQGFYRAAYPLPKEV